MSTPLRAAGLLLSIVCALGLWLRPAHAELRIAYGGPKQIALHPDEMPPGYVQFLARTTTNNIIARENGVPVAVYNKIGRMVGFETGYKERAGTHSTHVMCCVNVQVVQYRSPDGAAQAFALGQQMVKNTYGRDHGFRAMDDGLGTTAAQIFPCHCGTAAPQTVYIITTHLRRYLISTEVHFSPGTKQEIMSQTVARFQSLMANRVP